MLEQIRENRREIESRGGSADARGDNVSDQLVRGQAAELTSTTQNVMFDVG